MVETVLSKLEIRPKKAKKCDFFSINLTADYLFTLWIKLFRPSTSFFYFMSSDCSVVDRVQKGKNETIHFGAH